MRFRLTSPHYINDVILPEGTVVGTGAIPFNGKPSLNMEAADAEAEAFLAENPNYWEKTGQRPPVEILQAPNALVEGQRVGGLGPKADPSSMVNVPGNGVRDAAGNVVVDPALVAAIQGRPHNPFETKKD